VGKPENEENFEVFTVDGDVKVYVKKELLEAIEPGEKVFRFLIPEYGWHYLVFLNEK